MEKLEEKVLKSIIAMVYVFAFGFVVTVVEYSLSWFFEQNYYGLFIMSGSLLIGLMVYLIGYLLFRHKKR